MHNNFNTAVVKRLIEKKLVDDLFVSPETASNEQYYKATAIVIRELLEAKQKGFIASSNSKGKKHVHYLSMEFLLGRSLKNAVYNLELLEPFKEALEELGVKLTSLYECEPDAGLGNGGLGRLAACYLDALATLEIPATGYSILYEYGIFKQKIVDGWQTEQPDYWLPGGEVWLTPRIDQSIEIHFGGTVEEFWDNNYHHVNYKDYDTVIAVPYDMYIPGYDSSGVSVLRLWQAKSPGINMDSFNKGDYVGAFGKNSLGEVISKILYPNDSHKEGKALRLKQQYFLAAASIGDMVKKHFATYGQLENFAEKNAVHINDTHPTLAIPELMRILMDECGYSWDESWSIASQAFAYTNHTVLSEALERWDEELFKAMLPRIYQITAEINRQFCAKLYDRYHLDDQTVGRMAIFGNHEIRMANLCIATSHSVNGVSQLHSDIIKNELFKDFYAVAPYKFKNVTNGIASRRWLYQSNPLLTGLLKETIGDGFLKDMSQLERFKKFQDDKQVLTQLADIKLQNKMAFVKHIEEKTGTVLDPHSIFDVQVKRLHEYKRQHLNALNILCEYQYLKENPNADFVPKTYIFGAKAAPGYYFAKQIIKFICTLAKVIDNDPEVRNKLRIFYVENYDVTMSELLMPASEISEQISLAGKEASGTGNMKLMLGGAITLGTLDGANVEITEAVGFENAFIFGMTTDEVQQTLQSGYNPDRYYHNNYLIKKAIDAMNTGIGGETFTDIANSLRFEDSYMVMADFDSYRDAQSKASNLYKDTLQWQKSSLINIASSGIFCADRAINDYARTIWGIK